MPRFLARSEHAGRWRFA